jgi:LPPG:FO 2-phospho-L-lactate transferase
MGAPVVVLAGGTGGAKLARGMLDVAGEDLVVIANTADDADVYGASVSPDPDLVTFWLADQIDERGWGLRDDTFAVMDALRALGRDVWFNLGDRDLAWCLERRRMLDEGLSPTQALAALAAAIGVRARVLPMCDEHVHTRVKAGGAWHGFQEFMILRRAQGPVEDVAFEGIEYARASDAVLDAIGSARAIVIGPSNPVISIRPILEVPGVANALRDAPAPVVAVSPIVGGEVLKGPTVAFMDWAGLTLDAAGVAAAYGRRADGGLLDAILADETAPGGAASAGGVPVTVAPTLMDDPGRRREVAAAALELAGAVVR